MQNFELLSMVLYIIQIIGFMTAVFGANKLAKYPYLRVLLGVGGIAAIANFFLLDITILTIMFGICGVGLIIVCLFYNPK